MSNNARTAEAALAAKASRERIDVYEPTGLTALLCGDLKEEGAPGSSFSGFGHYFAPHGPTIVRRNGVSRRRHAHKNPGDTDNGNSPPAIHNCPFVKLGQRLR